MITVNSIYIYNTKRVVCMIYFIGHTSLIINNAVDTYLLNGYIGIIFIHQMYLSTSQHNTNTNAITKRGGFVP